ncbi:UDP-4-amino-4,6-dideoxy-N-acetyl-beta-L-altrosamine transaminase [Marinobacterium sp. D7]|uniref:UDP-4-amino-4, 6-dideoxy-N-acetyl-beta-L-altrosamine transaminase n=1 Tax=Marinobacterium ramblicola TaxID=2849041 RepID=UPI001C2DA880|nr:UDP-4-amino-4,6-dideoxy-N-acetyl-beta-L-altrosamine transaminase [Marinobacterium ramblicola]MBV1788873.1 UDP-4-amino-4,6-dideoxy-N-acetyl-beta-L-altrosamine transaminase [Marinobacterium ramblicola]
MTTKLIPYGRHSISDDDIAAVVEVMKHGNLTQGDRVPVLERALSEYVNAPYVTLVNSATSALHLACKALGVASGDLVWTSPVSFVASANCARYCGADVDFVDIDPKTLNLSLDALQEKLLQARSKGRLPKVIVCVHFAGLTVDMRRLRLLTAEYDIALVEDASHALGADYAGEKVGAGRYSDAVVFSFHPVKMITTAEGGAVVTRNETLHTRVRRLRSHGIERDMLKIENKEQPPWYYEQVELGFNFRLSDLQAALGLSQLQRLDKMVVRRRQLAAQYDHSLQGLPLVLPPRGNEPETSSCWHLYLIRLEEPELRLALYQYLHKHGIGVQVHYIPIHFQPDYRQLGFEYGQFPQSENYYERCLTLPLYPDLTDAEQMYVVERITRFFKTVARSDSP